MTFLKSIVAAGLIVTGSQVSAQATDTFQLPAGCDAYVTVQAMSCSVDHHFTCSNDPEGLKRRVSIDDRGLTYAGATNAESQWVESFHLLSGHSEMLGDVARDPASFSELVEAGIDTYDFTTESEEVGLTRYVGQDSLTGNVVTIDGVALDETDYNITAYDEDGNLKWSSKGREYISKRFGFFLAGQSEITTPDDSFDIDDTPVEFIFPGEPGFLSSNPKHGCGATLSSFEVD